MAPNPNKVTENRLMWLPTSTNEPVQNVITYDTTSVTNLFAVQRTKELRRVLVDYDLIDSPGGFFHRMNVLSKLNRLVKEWIYQLGLARNMNQDEAEAAGGTTCSFGSYKLGVSSKGADIDALCVAPQHVNRSDFFQSFFSKLKSSSEIKNLRAIEEAFVPILKMNFDGVEIDLLFARLDLKEVPNAIDLKDDMILKNLDQRCVRSLNGCRVTDEILRLVPNEEAFKLALRVIKLWAKRHRIYSNLLGYLGGVSWAMLVARTCQLYPNAVAATIVHKFFLVFSQWEWPQPVLLKQPTNPNLNFPIWDPKENVADRSHLMPIITPAYPQQNSTFNVSNSTRTVLVEELEIGLRLTEEIMCGRADWQLLFETPNFFSKYKHFLILIASSNNKENQIKWAGLVESKIRHLVTAIERNCDIQLAQANTEIFNVKANYFSQEKPNSLWVVGLQFRKTVCTFVDVIAELKKFSHIAKNRAKKINLYEDDMAIETTAIYQRELSKFISIDIIKRDRPVSSILSSVIENGNGLDSTSQRQLPPPTYQARKSTFDKFTPCDQPYGQRQKSQYQHHRKYTSKRKASNHLEENQPPQRQHFD